MAREESLYRPTELTYKQRADIFDKTFQRVIKNYFDPNYNGTKWPERARDERGRILAIPEPEAFESSHQPYRVLS